MDRQQLVHPGPLEARRGRSPRPRHRGAAQKIIPAPEEAKAIPALDKEALAAGSAHIDTVSGATYTSGGYVTSLQSALDKAGL